jgi:hypothetical protein
LAYIVDGNNSGPSDEANYNLPGTWRWDGVAMWHGRGEFVATHIGPATRVA